ncbi:MAG: hypothetical protein SFY80_15455 [Verrucomicrobiota bacterium]|nr:hypothetical protein [Verrucomicrobiota bacterium]
MKTVKNLTIASVLLLAALPVCASITGNTYFTDVVGGSPIAEAYALSKDAFSSHSFADPDAAAGEYNDEMGAESTGQQLGAEYTYGWYDANGSDGTVHSIGVPYKHKFTPRVSGSIKARFLYSDFADMNVTLKGYGLTLGVPYGVYIKEDGTDYRWTLTPSVGLGIRTSDYLRGAFLMSPGLSSNYLYKISDNLILNVGNSVTYHFTFKWDDYAEPTNDQVVFANGVQAIVPVDRWVFSGYYIFNYLTKGNLDSNKYHTMGVSGGYRISKKISLRLNYYYEKGKDWAGHNIALSSAWDF